MSSSSSILIILPNSLGDAILSSGLIKAASDELPSADLTLVLGPTTPDLFRATPRLRRIIILKKKPWKGHWFIFWRETIGTSWSLIIDLRNSAFSRLLLAKRRAYTTVLPGQHRVLQNATALKLAPPPAPVIYLDEQAHQRAAILLAKAKSGPLIALGPGANWPPKRWPAHCFAELVNRLRSSSSLKDATILIAAAPNEARDLEELMTALPKDRVINLIGEDLLTIAACFRSAHLFIGNDSGLMHLAASQDIPTLGLFGPGFVDLYRPWGPLGAYAKTPETNDELRARLTTKNSPNLMETLTVEKVYTEAIRLLERFHREKVPSLFTN